MANLISPRQNAVRIPLLENPYAFTGAWSDIGPLINCKGMNSIALWLELTINDSTDVDFRIQGYGNYDESIGYSVPTEEIFIGVNNVYPQVFHIQQYQDQNLVVQATTADLIPYVKLQVRDNNLPGSPAVLESVYVSFQRIPRG